jgi:hypothetical protein
MLRTLAFLVIGASSLCAQQSLFQDSKGETAIYLGAQKANVLVNFGDSKIQAGYIRNFPNSDRWRIGFGVNGTAQNGIATIIKNGTAQAGVGGDITLTQDLTSDSNKDLPGPNTGSVITCMLCSHWMVYSIGYARSSLNTITDVQPIPPVQNHNFDSYSARIGWNALLKNQISDFLVGITAGVQRKNNTDSLDTVSVSTNVLGTLQNNQQLTISENSKSAYLGAYVKYIAAPINVDFIWFPGTNKLVKPTKDNPQPNKQRYHLGIDIFERSDVGESSKYRYIAPGLGAFLTNPGSPTRPIGGVTVEYKDGKVQASLVTGWTF